MANTMEYTVLPLEPSIKPIPSATSIPLAENERNYVNGMSGGAKFWMWVVLCVSLGSLTKSFSVGVLVASIGTIVMAIAMKSNNVEQAEREKAKKEKEGVERENQSELNRTTSEAQSLSTSLTRTYTSSGKLVGDLPGHLQSASEWVAEAEAEFKDNAFAPFWDAVESAALELAHFNDKTKLLSKNADGYYSALGKRKHSFPIFPVDTNTVPDASPTIERLERVIRKGQTNYHFAAIWEHRRTREVLIAGFHTLGEAVNNLGATIEDSLASLQSSLSSELANISKEQIKTRESLDMRMVEQNRMLDNIQHKRKPGASDTPSYY